MTTTTAALAPPGLRAPGTLRIAGATARTFADHTQPLVSWNDLELAMEVLPGWLPGLEPDDLRAARGTSMITMSQALLEDTVLDPFDSFDSVLLAYAAPDLYNAEVAGCWVSDQLPGAPVPAAVEGPGSVFTALRIADGLARLGELDRGMVLGFDQNAVARLRDPGRPGTDSAVMLLVGADGDLAIGALGDDRVPDPERDPRPATRILTGLAAGNHCGRVVLGPSLVAVATRLGPAAVTVVAGGCTGVWSTLAKPVDGPVLLADFDPIADRLYYCVVTPGAAR